ncbi:MAG: hypothetical protein M3R52_01060 [Acidobacteriota bacterium]|nr:hypothetical protein [Acidobacteriota bacterium]
MFESLLIPFVALLLVVVILGFYLYLKRRKRRERIAAILSGTNLLGHWTYTPNEWQRAVAEEFTWAKNKGDMGHVYITPSAIYVKSDSGDRLTELCGNGKVVTHASYRGAEGSALKIRVRWKVVTRYQDRADEVKYFKEDHRIPVPLKYAGEARRVADYFTARLEANLEAYTAVVSDDEPISLFGKDSF